jgi:GTP-binding protein HflX
LLNVLTNSRVTVEDKLFATLDPASRRLRFPKERDVILTDTVGFIQDLPPDLINAFRSTLEELEDADLLLHVADVSNPYVEEQIRSVQMILREMDLAQIPQILVFNKADLVEGERSIYLTRKYEGLTTSALQGDGLEELSRRVQERIFGRGRADGEIGQISSIQPTSQEAHQTAEGAQLVEVRKDGTDGP